MQKVQPVQQVGMEMMAQMEQKELQAHKALQAELDLRVQLAEQDKKAK